MLPNNCRSLFSISLSIFLLIIFIWISNVKTITTTGNNNTTSINDNLNNSIVAGEEKPKFMKNDNLTSSETMMTFYELMLPKHHQNLLSSNPLDQHHHHYFNRLKSPNHHYSYHLTGPALIDPEPILLSTEPQHQNEDVQLIIDYYNQLYNSDQSRTFPFTTSSLEPTLTYSLDEFSSFLPNYPSTTIFPSTTPCSLKKEAAKYQPSKTKSTQSNDCTGGKDHQEDSDNDKSIPYDPFEYLNHFRDGGESKPDDNNSNNNGADGGSGGEDQNQDSEDDDDEEEEEENNNSTEQPNETTNNEDNGNLNDNEDENKGSDTINEEENSTNNTDNEKDDDETEPETNDTKITNEHIDLDTKTARKNEPNDNNNWGIPSKNDEEEFDQDESSFTMFTVRPSRKNRTNTNNNEIITRSKRSLSSMIDQLKANIESFDPLKDLKPSSSNSHHRSNFFPNLIPIPGRFPFSSPLPPMSSANLFRSPPNYNSDHHHDHPNYFLDHWNLPTATNNIRTSNVNNRFRSHRHHPRFPLQQSNPNPYFPYPYNPQHLNNNNNNYRFKVKKPPVIQSQPYSFKPPTIRPPTPLPVVYSDLEDIHNQQKLIHDSFRNGELLPTTFDDYDHQQQPPPPPEQQQQQYPPDDNSDLSPGVIDENSDSSSYLGNGEEDNNGSGAVDENGMLIPSSQRLPVPLPPSSIPMTNYYDDIYVDGVGTSKSPDNSITTNGNDEDGDDLSPEMFNNDLNQNYYHKTQPLPSPQLKPYYYHYKRNPIQYGNRKAKKYQDNLNAYHGFY